MLKRILQLFMLPFIVISGYQAQSQKNADTDSIRGFTQQLIDGIATGDTSAWSKYLDESCIITSEDGSVKTKHQFISNIKVPPNYMKVKETISNPLFRGNSNTIVFIYTANLSLGIHGQQRVNEICQTDTWYKTNSGWKLISNEALDKQEAPSIQNIPTEVLKAISGDYKLSGEYDDKIFARDGKLFSQVNGGKESELKCESDYTYFIDNRFLLRYIFVHDENNKIIEMISRRAGRDIIIPKTN